ncbi:hypothetical protein [Streptomyces sp. NPDC059076]|uniref:hypothetical protein n=1 Tax=unclassified Streptomyces TaxID=2593676 RepID=UPI0036B0C9D1
MAAARTSKALEAWRELNDRQQGTLTVIFILDQETEQGRRGRAARGEWDNRPASEWRAIDFAHEPSDRKLFGWTTMQTRLAGNGWDNQGNGSTIAALAARGLLERDIRRTTFGLMHLVRLTTAGRAAARAGTANTPGGPRKAALSERSWEVLALLWRADTRGETLKWGYSATVERVLIGKHVPPLAEFLTATGGGYGITDRGRDFYREHYAAHAAAHPNVTALHPDGARAEPWPTEADNRLARLARTRRALALVWKDARDQHQAAAAELDPEPPTGYFAEQREKELRSLPEEAALLRADLARMWQDTARQRAEQAAADTARLDQLLTDAARTWAAAALHGYNAAVTGDDPLAVLPAAGDDPDGWTELRLVPPAKTGVHGLDDDAGRLYAAAVGAPRKRRGPAPKKRRRFAGPPQATEPGTPYTELARWLTDQLKGASLVRRLHPHRLATDTIGQADESQPQPTAEHTENRPAAPRSLAPDTPKETTP